MDHPVVLGSACVDRSHEAGDSTEDDENVSETVRAAAGLNIHAPASVIAFIHQEKTKQKKLDICSTYWTKPKTERDA